MATTRDTTPPAPEDWRTTIDGWVRDPAIRNFGLTTLAVLLAGLALVVGLASGALAAIVSTLLPNLLAKTIAGGTLSAASGGLWLLKRRRDRRKAAAASTIPRTPQTPSSNDSPTDERRPGL